MRKIILSVSLVSFFIYDSFGASITWDGEGGDGLWSTAANWVGNIVPLPGDDVILNNAIVTGSFTVTLPPGISIVTVSSLTITPSTNNIIILILPSTNTSPTAFTANGNGDAVVLNNGAVFINASGSSAGTPVSVTSANFFRINNGGRYIHRTQAGHTNYLVSRLSAAAGTEKGVFEFDVPTASYTISLTGRTYGTLVLSSTANANAVTYSGNGAGALNINGDLQINPGVIFSIGLSASMIIHGNLGHSATSVFNLQNSTNNNVVKVAGDVNSAGTITQSNAGLPVLELNGTINQNISINGTVINNVSFRVNNAAGITLTAPLTLPYKLELLNGKIKTDAVNILTLADNATVAGGSVTSFVEGPMKKTGDDNFIFPVGKGSMYAPIGFTSSGLSVTDVFEAEYFRLNPQTEYGMNYQSPPIHHISYVEYWKLDKITGNINTPAKITLAVSEYSFAKDMSTLFVSRYDETDKQWKSDDFDSRIPGVDNPPYVTGTVTSDLVSPSGIFTLATSEPEAINPLPIKLLSFNVFKADQCRAIITWQLADYSADRIKFEVQRSLSATEFIAIKNVAGTLYNRYYTITDDQSLQETKHYRLKMTSEDGSIDYSQVVTLSGEQTGLVVNVYPNPVSDRSIIEIHSACADNLQFIIYDVSGKKMKQWNQTIQAGTTELPMQINAFGKGIYFLSVCDDKPGIVIRFIKR